MSISTTLITFILGAPEGTFEVELLGSWDNFTKPYKLSRDRRTGDHSWRGCHFFEGITCDGDTSDLSAMRNGGLMMGGTYWYYYRLNSETEYHDPLEPYTSCCPLLPGQPVNVLDVPIQPRRPSSGNDSSESLESQVFTLDPKDKYLPPGVRRARTTSAIQQRKALVRQTSRIPLTTADRKASDCSNSTPNSGSTRDGPTLRPQRSLISIFDKMRRTRSVGSSTPRATTSWHRKVFSRGSSRAGLKSESSRRIFPSDDIPAVPQVPAHILAREERDRSSNTSSLPLSFKEPTECAKIDPLVSLGASMRGLSVSANFDGQNHNTELGQSASQEEATPYSIPNTSLHGKYGAPSKPKVMEWKDSHAIGACTRHESLNRPQSEARNISENPSTLTQYHPNALTSQSPIFKDDVHTFSPTFLDDESELGDQDDAMFGLSSTESSCATDETLSPEIPSKLTQSIPISPMQLSQPETPTMSDFDDDTASWIYGSESIDVDIINLKAPSRAPPLPPPTQNPTFPNPFRIYAPMNGFQGYSLPQDEQGSMHTLRKPASSRSFQTDHPLHHQTSSKDLVHSWNDGSGHRITALEELLDDHGYLGAFIL